MSAISEVLALAARQAGTLSSSQARSLLTSHEYARARQTGFLTPVGLRALRVAGFPQTPLHRAWLGVHEVGPPCVVAGVTNGLLRGWPEVRDEPTRPRIVVPEARELRGIRYASVRRLSHVERYTTVPGPLGIPVLSTLDTVVTAAVDVDDDTLLTLIQRLCFAGELDVGALLGRTRTGLPGSATITRAATWYRSGLESPSEVRVYRILQRRDMAPEHLNVWLVADDGQRFGPVDGWSDHGVGYEVDGQEAHGTVERQRRDEWKTNRAVEAGAMVVRFTGSDIARPDDLAAQWAYAVNVAATSRPRGFQVVHQRGRTCPCQEQGPSTAS
jgi:hypothetical protein